MPLLYDEAAMMSWATLIMALFIPLRFCGPVWVVPVEGVLDALVELEVVDEVENDEPYYWLAPRVACDVFRAG